MREVACQAFDVNVTVVAILAQGIPPSVMSTAPSLYPRSSGLNMAGAIWPVSGKASYFCFPSSKIDADTCIWIFSTMQSSDAHVMCNFSRTVCVTCVPPVVKLILFAGLKNKDGSLKTECGIHVAGEDSSTGLSNIRK